MKQIKIHGTSGLTAVSLSRFSAWLFCYYDLNTIIKISLLVKTMNRIQGHNMLAVGLEKGISGPPLLLIMKGQLFAK